jgi:dipeptidyl aminopeptidase/acylaminoacyl peptidase
MPLKRLALSVLFVTLGTAAGISRPSHAQSVPQAPQAASAGGLMSVEDFFKNPSYLNPVLSPNGQFLAVLAPVNGRMNLVVLDLQSRKGNTLSQYKDFDVTRMSWISNDRLVFSLGNLNEPSGFGRQRGGGLFAANRDGTQFREISKTVQALVNSGGFVYRGHDFAARVPDSETDIFTISRERSVASADVYRINTVTGQKRLLTLDNPGDVFSYVFDDKGVARFAVSGADDASQSVHYREDDKAPWRKVHTAKIGEPVFAPIAFSPTDANELYAASNEGRDTTAVFSYDVRTMKRGNLIAANAIVDMGLTDDGGGNAGALVFDATVGKLVGVRYNAEKAGTVWLDDDYKNLQRSIDAALPDAVNRFSRVGKSQQFLIRSHSDRKPAEWLVLDNGKKSMEALVSSRPWVKPSNLVPMRPIAMKQRDGTEILGYYLLPASYKTGDKLPLLVNVHGGPWVRADSWEYAMWGAVEAQFFASRGYAVLLPNFRGTAGLGKKILMGGQKQFGKLMQDDIEDGVNWAIKEGFADPGKVCIYGASYGGYAALAGPAKAPDMFKCSVAALVVSDLGLLMTSSQGDIPTSKSGVALWSAMVGDPKTDREALRAASPVFNADKIKAKVFIVSGEDDIRTPIEQAEVMRAALRKAGNEPRWMVKAEEGHGFGKVENRVDFYTEMLKFLDEHTGTKRP